MTTATVGAPSASMNDGDAIDWPHVASEVQRLQMRIAKAVRMTNRRVEVTLGL